MSRARTFSEKELRSITREYTGPDGDARVITLARYALSLRKALKPFAEFDYTMDRADSNLVLQGYDGRYIYARDYHRAARVLGIRRARTLLGRKGAKR